MIEGVWHKIQKRLTKIALKRLVKKSLRMDEIDLGVAWNRVTHILICWPGEGLDLLAARVVLNRVRERFPHAGLTVIALPGVGASTPHEVEAEMITVQRKDLTWSGLPKKWLQTELSSKGYSAVVDLSPQFDPLAAYFSILSEAPLRIGFAGPGCDLALNFQVSPRSDRTGIDRYRVLARYIG
jgi:hypothetical protein